MPVYQFEARGAVKQLFKCKDPEVLLDGPAGTGKSRGCLEKVHALLTKYKGSRGVMVRKTRASLTNTGMVTYEKEVLKEAERSIIKFHTPTQGYRYPNGSTLVVGGMDDATKVMSSQYDFAYVMEATELTVDDWEALGTRLRNGKAPYSQLIADCNPSYPAHWLNQRALTPATTRFWSTHKDNAAYWNEEKQDWTDLGKQYIARLGSLTGTRRIRLLVGKWVAAEGMVYDQWNPEVHIINSFPIPADWPSYWTIDFGFTNPFVWMCWRRDPQGRLFCTHQIYKTKRIVEDHCAVIKSLNLQAPSAVICDHDAEDRATLERHLGVRTIPARKEVTTGIQAMESYLRNQADGKPKMFYLRDNLIEVDRELQENKKPISSEEEYESYIWEQPDPKKQTKEVPVKKFDHAKDAERYLVLHLSKGYKVGMPRICALN